MGRHRISGGTKRLEKNLNEIIRQLFLILFVPHNRKTIRVAHRSEYNNKRKKQVILLMIIDGKKWHYLGVTNLPALFKAKLSNHHEDFYRLNCFN